MVYTEEELKQLFKTIGTTKEEWADYKKCTLSVSKIKESFSEPFDSEKMASYCSHKYYDDPSSKYYQKTPEMILEDWNAASEKGKASGRLLDDYIGYILEGLDDNSKTKLFETIENSPIEVKNKLKSFEKFYNEQIKPTSLEYLARERSLCYLPFGVKGRFDAIFMHNGVVVLIDWKNDKEINTTNKYGKKLYGPLHDCSDCELNIYTIQLYIYKYILRKKYNIDNKIKTLVVQVKEDGVVAYAPTIKYSDELVESIMSFGKTIAESSNI